jgi:predicted Zn-dependent protease
MIPTRRHLEFASGYLELGMVTEASDELEAITGSDRLSAEVMQVRADLYMEGKEWELLLAVARELARQRPEAEKGWIYSAYALRELGRIGEAKAVLIAAEPKHGVACAVLHYNLACYHCLLGERAEARRRLAMACRMNPEWKAAALEDADLAALWDEIAAMP